MDGESQVGALTTLQSKGGETMFLGIDINKIQSIYKEALELINNDDTLSAVEILEKGVRELKNANAYFFEEIFQLMCWTRECQKLRVHERRKLNGGYAIYSVNLYYLLGFCYVELGDNEKAAECYKKALKLFPYDVDSRFEMINLLKKECNFDMLHEALQEVHRYIYRPDDLARLYRDYGWIFVETKEWVAATACYFSSFAYADERGVQKAENELGFIEETTGKDITALLPDIEDRDKLFAQYHIPLGFNEAIVDMAFSEYQKCQDGEDDNLGSYFREICLVYVNPLEDLRNHLVERTEELKHRKYSYRFVGEKNKELNRIVTIDLEINYETDDAQCMADNASWDVFEMQVSSDIREKICSTDGKVDITEAMKEWLDFRN